MRTPVLDRPDPEERALLVAVATSAAGLLVLTAFLLRRPLAKLTGGLR
jgi:hypothetical protein